MIIDIHTHTFPDKIAAAAVDKLRKAGFVPTSDFDKGLEATVAFFKAQM